MILASLSRILKQTNEEADVTGMRRVKRGRRGVVVLATIFITLPTGRVAARQPDPGQRVVTLEQALRMALQNNSELRAARLGQEAAEDQVQEAFSAVYPTLDLNTSYTRNLAVPGTFLPAIFTDPDADPDELVEVKFGADNTWNLSLRAEQPLFRPAAFLAAGASKQFRSLQGEVVRGREIAVAARVKSAYYDVLLAEENVRLNENTLRRIRQTLDETRKMNQAGLASNYDVLRLEVEAANVEPGVRRARNAASAARRLLAIELGLAASDTVGVTGSLSEVDFVAAVAGAGAPSGVSAVVGPTDLVLSSVPPQLTEQEALALARSNRSDMRQLDMEISLRRTQLRAEQVQYLPEVLLFGQYSINAQQNGSPRFFGASDAQRSYGRQVGIQVTVPVFAGFSRPARIGQARVAVAQASTQRNLIAQQLEHEVKTLFEQVDEARLRGAAQQLALRQATRGFEIARVQYREGISSQLEVTDAEVALRQSEFNYAEAAYDYLVARARLDEALGLAPAVADE